MDWSKKKREKLVAESKSPSTPMNEMLSPNSEEGSFVAIYIV